MNSFELANDFANVTCMRIYTQEIKVRFNSKDHLHRTGFVWTVISSNYFLLRVLTI